MPNKHGEKDWLDTALPLLNSLEIVDFDGDGETLYFAYIENTDKNKETLLKAGVLPKEIEKATGTEGEIELTHFIWKFAKWFDGKQFIAKDR